VDYLSAMQSFEIVSSQVNSMEIENVAKKEQVRVTGKSWDDLQAVIAAVRAKDFPVALQFTNRDWEYPAALA
jgi:uncharacterized protein YajQ (UPF0234 family)